MNFCIPHRPWGFCPYIQKIVLNDLNFVDYTILVEEAVAQIGISD